MNSKYLYHMIKTILLLGLVLFSASQAQNPLILFAPNGGENWKVGTQEIIQWLSNNGPARVNLEFSVDGGANWEFINTNIVNPTSGSAQYVWTIPDRPSTECLVRVSDAVDGIPADTSDAPFTISRIPKLDLITPNGGEIWQVGTPELIQWSSVVSDDPANVKLEYSLDAGNNWIVIAESISNSGQYAWTPPEPPSTTCLMAISDARDGVPSDTSNETFTIRPQPALTVVSPNGGESYRVGSSQVINWTSRISSDPVNVRLEYSVNGGGSWTIIESSTPNDGEYIWTIPNNPSNDCLIRVSDAADGDPTDVSNEPFTIEIPLSVTVSGPASGQSWIIGSSHDITWSTTGAVPSVNIELSRNNGLTWETLRTNTANDGSETWVVQLPRSSQCRIKVSSSQDPDVAGTSSTFSIIPQTVSSMAKEEPQPSGSAQSAYRLLSVPLNLSSTAPQDVLEDDLGAYDNTKWRFYDYQDGNYVEYANARNFAPGRSFFLIVKDAGKVITAGAGELVADSVVNISLYAGWNFIANPFNFNIPIAALSNSSNLITYDGSWSTPGDVTILRPWEGYALKVESATTLAIRPIPVGQALLKSSENILPEWTIQIKAACEDARDNGNFAGVSKDASDGWDQHDYYEPPPIGEYVMVYFPHPEWKQHADIYTGDFRSAGREGYIWDFEIRTPIQDVVKLSFECLAELPEEYEVRLIDHALQQAQDLKSKNHYSFLNHNDQQLHKFSLVAGTSLFVQSSTMDFESVVSDYQLYHNFPNPFNLSTTIPFALPQPQKITLKIFNLLGEEVATILNQRFFEAGFHKAFWDGRDNQGRVVASGIYLYRLDVGTFTQTRKMLLVK
jgi:hypothetical protein